MKIVGVTGEIGAGKSTVSNFFKKLGAKVIDADKISHRCLEENKEIIIEEFSNRGLEFENYIKNLRGQLSQIVFDDEAMLETLCKLLHPCIVKNINKEIDKIKKLNPNALAVIDCPLLFEMEVDELTDYIIFVTAPLDERVNRVVKSSDLSREEVIKRSNKQISLNDRKDSVDFTIYNAKEKGYVEEQVGKIWDGLAHSS